MTNNFLVFDMLTLSFMGVSGSIAPKISYLTRLGLRVKPWISMRISLGMGLRGPDIRPGFDNRV